MGLVSHTTLSKGRGVALVVIFVLAAVLTPPDVFTQVLMAGRCLQQYVLKIRVAGQGGIDGLGQRGGDAGIINGHGGQAVQAGRLFTKQRTVAVDAGLQTALSVHAPGLGPR
ncbi:MAG: twin-arginine translocase subunit TatC [Gammaproteobacteria bacterium]